MMSFKDLLENAAPCHNCGSVQCALCSSDIARWAIREFVKSHKELKYPEEDIIKNAETLLSKPEDFLFDMPMAPIEIYLQIGRDILGKERFLDILKEEVKK